MGISTRWWTWTWPRSCLICQCSAYKWIKITRRSRKRCGSWSSDRWSHRWVFIFLVDVRNESFPVVIRIRLLPKTDQVIMDIKSTWQIDGYNFIKLSGEIVTPFEVLNHVQGSLQYLHQSNTKSYFLESYLNYSKKAEMNVRAHLKDQSVTLNLESSLEGLR